MDSKYDKNKWRALLAGSVKDYQLRVQNIEDAMIGFTRNGYTRADLEQANIIPSMLEFQSRERARIKRKPTVHKPFEQLVKDQAYARMANALAFYASNRQEEEAALEDIEELVEIETKQAKMGWGEW